MSEVPEDEALIHLQLQPEDDLFPCCDGTEEISQSSSNDTPAPERTVCQPCSTGSQMTPTTRGDVTSEEDDKEVVSGEAAEGLSEEQEDESQEVLEEEDQEVADVSHVADSDSVEEASEEAKTVEEDEEDNEFPEEDMTEEVSIQMAEEEAPTATPTGEEEEDAEEVTKEEPVEEESQEQEESMESDTISGKLMAEAAPVNEAKVPADTKVSVEDKILAAEEPDIAQTKESVEVDKVVEESTIAELVQEPGQEAWTDPPAKEKQPVTKESVSDKPAHKSKVKGTPV